MIQSSFSLKSLHGGIQKWNSDYSSVHKSCHRKILNSFSRTQNPKKPKDSRTDKYIPRLITETVFMSHTVCVKTVVDCSSVIEWPKLSITIRNSDFHLFYGLKSRRNSRDNHWQNNTTKTEIPGYKIAQLAITNWL